MKTKMLRAPLGALFACCARPALADHAMSGGGGSGGGMSVFGPMTLDEKQWAAGLRLLLTHPEQRSDAELEALAGQDIHAHNIDDNLNASLGLAYGVTHHLTVSVELPYVRRDGLREAESAGEVVPLGNVSGIGDATLIAHYRLTEGEGPAFAVVGGLKVPTGRTDEKSPEGEHLETEQQPGTGSWDSIVGASGSVPLGGVTLTASALYQFATMGSQRTRLGDRMQGGIVLAHRFGAAPHDDHEHHEHHEAHGHQSWDAFVELGGEWEGQQAVDGKVEDASGGSWTWVAPGVRLNAASGWTAGAAIALPLWQDIRAIHPDNRFRVMLNLGRAF